MIFFFFLIMSQTSLQYPRLHYKQIKSLDKLSGVLRKVISHIFRYLAPCQFVKKEEKKCHTACDHAIVKLDFRP